MQRLRSRHADNAPPGHLCGICAAYGISARLCPTTKCWDGLPIGVGRRWHCANLLKVLRLSCGVVQVHCGPLLLRRSGTSDICRMCLHRVTCLHGPAIMSVSRHHASIAMWYMLLPLRPAGHASRVKHTDLHNLLNSTSTTQEREASIAQ